MPKDGSHVLLHKAVCLPGHVTSSGGANVEAWVTPLCTGTCRPRAGREDQDEISRV